jgi:endonuclease/exonuclease/phosphatase family metal-dependent hydrolase
VSPVAAAAGWRGLARRRTFPSPGPKLHLDHVLVHPRRHTTAVRVDSPAVSVSDHKPLVVELPGLR